MRTVFLAFLGLVSMGVSCGGSSPSAPGGGGPPAATTTITLTSAGASPAAITVSQGTRVRFTNNDNRQHQMNSDPHPDHTDCPELNAIGFISAGQTKETGNLNTVRTCRYHDHDLPSDTRFQGRIVIQ